MRILVVEDDKTLGGLLCSMVHHYLDDAECDLVGTLADALEKFPRADGMILDLALLDSGPQNTYDAFKDVMSQKPVIIVSGMDDTGCGLDGIKHGAVDFIGKPFDATRLGVALDKAFPGCKKGQ